ncbi:MAG: hypothetical protein FH753_11385 [Firmicutes bacterium]|nr:hypothetical protein [Bacillota bacterium]
MPCISKIRFTNVIYENGGKRYNDDIFEFDGYNGAILLENGGGKTVFIQTAIQAILPHQDVADRKIIDTLSLEGNPCHIAIEWILNERPRRYAVTSVTLFVKNNKLSSYKYVYEYGHNDKHSLENLPFVKKTNKGLRPSSRGEISEYYSNMKSEYINASTFKTIREFHEYIEENYKIIPSEWRKISLINSAEGSVEEFFDGCKTTGQLVDKLLIPVVEEAISDKVTDNFVDTFDKQREHFKKHKQLTEKIEECSEIKDQIEYYVDVYSDYNNINDDYNEKKRYAKSIFELVNNKSRKLEYMLDENKLNKEKLQDDIKELKRKEKSFEIYKLKIKKDEEKLILEDKDEAFQRIYKNYDKKKKRYETLDILKIRLDIKRTEDEIKNLKNQIELLNKDKDINELRNKLNENSKMIKGYFIKEEENLKSKLDLLNNQYDNYNGIYNDLLDNKKEILLNKEELNKSINEKNGEINRLSKDLLDIRGRILENKDEDIKNIQNTWRKRIGVLEQRVADLKVKLSNLKTEKEDLENILPKKRKELKKLSNNLRDTQNKLDIINNEENKQILKLQELNSLNFIDSLYTKEGSIINTLENKIEHLNKQKEDLLKDERKVSRLYDDYTENKFFTVEPLLEKLILSLNNNFSYIELGTKYIQRVSKNLNKKESLYFDKYPYWSLSVIVKDTEVDKLRDKLLKRKDKITYPIFILSDTEALDIIEKGKARDILTVFPNFWRDNLLQQNFINWKEELYEEYKKVNKIRKSKEKELDYYNDMLKGVRNFFIEFPFSEYKELNKDKHKFKEEIDSIDDLIESKEEKIKSIDKEMFRINNDIEKYKDEKQVLNSKMEWSQIYISKDKDLKKYREDNYNLERDLKKKNRNLKKVERNMDSYLRLLEDLKGKISSLNDKISYLKSNELYKEVKSYKTLFTDKTIDGLKSKRKSLIDTLEDKQRDIKYYREDLKEKIKIKENLNKDLDRKLSMCGFEISKNLTFPSYGEEEMNDLVREIKKLKPKVKKLEDEKNEALENFKNLKAKYEISLENFLKVYDSLIEFTESIYKINDDLNKEFRENKKREDNLNKIYEKLTTEKKEIDDCINILERKNERYLFLTEDVKPIKLDDSILKDFPYNRKKFIEDIIEKLNLLYKRLENTKKNVDTQKSKFIEFCNDNISDPKLRNMAIGGVNYKNNYKEIKKWQNQMEENITRIINIAKDDMREHDKEIQHFLEQLYIFLRTLTEQLKEIPKKTRIKVEDKWKQIYRFNVPDWEEQQGKEELRNHINWMIKQLENSEFKNNDGSENLVKIRNEIEKWLKSKQLLRIVLKDKVIKISCRKVTNDGRISSAPTSWEYSNKWSGGEKWSKNMTLFLGILNYLAEKRQNINTSNKTNRTVIVDNPFGKASSDHVLDPVFFIAEKLGFQIIALTAHTDGKYIRNYFPVVYSCKLREASNGHSFIIDKEKEIKYAFFKDNDPKALDRLGKQEQIDFLKDL